MSDLLMRDHCEQNDDGDARRRDDELCALCLRGKIGQEPHDRDEDADQRQVREAIGAHLLTGLNQTNHRQEHDDEP